MKPRPVYPNTPPVLRALSALLSAAALALGLACAVPPVRGATQPPVPEPQFTAKELAQGFSDQRIIAKPRDGSEALAEATESREQLGLRRRFARFGGMRVLNLNGATPRDMIARLRATGLYEYVEPDYIRKKSVSPNDPRFNEQWSLENSGSNPGTSGGIAGSDIKAFNGWNTRTSAASVIVAVVDSGVLMTHQDIAANLWTNTAEVAGNGVDDDHDGYIDDVHGINSIVSAGTAAAGNPTDDEGHGSHVAGIIGAVGNNGIGITGVAWSVKIMPLKFLNSTGNGNISDAIECIDYAIAHGANVINASYGAEDPKSFSQAELDAIGRARDAGIVFVAAAGNDALDMDISRAYPASYPMDNIVAVGNSTNLDDASASSNFGSGAVELFAPGTDILSLGIASNSDYVRLTGTSMAAPHVSGTIALLRAQFPGDNYRGLINRLLRGVQVKTAFNGKAQTRGRLDLNGAITTTTNRPFNDDFANRAIITGSNFAIRSSNALATKETGEPSHAGVTGGASLWWSWTPSASATVTFDTTGSAIDTTLAIYTGSSVGALTPVASNDNFTGTTSRVQFTVQSGTTYQIAVDGKNGATGLVLLNIGSVPLNDNFAGAQVVTGDSVQVKTTNANASREPNEPAIAGISGGRSLWFKWTAPSAKRYQVSAFSTDVDTLAAVYTGTSIDALTLVSANDDFGGQPSALCTVDATAGTTYYITVDAKASLSGAIAFTIVDSNWQFATTGAVTGSPAVGPDGTVYVGSTDGILYAISSTGAQLWQYQTGSLIDTCSPAVTLDGNTIYTGSADGYLYAISKSGDLLWRFQTGGPVSNSPAIAADGTIYIKSDDGYLYAIDQGGSQRWRFNAGGVTYASPVVAWDGTIYIGSGGSQFYALNPDGSLKWSFTANGDIYSAAAVDAAGNVYFTTLTGRLYSLWPSGAGRWFYDSGGPASSSPALNEAGTAVYFAGYDSKLHAVNTTSGAALWTFDLGDQVRASSPLVTTVGYIIIGSYDGLLYVVNPDGSLRRTYATGNWIRSCPISRMNTIYVGSNDNKLYSFPAGSGYNPNVGAWPAYRQNSFRLGRPITDPGRVTITQQPQSRVVVPGNAFTLSVATSGGTPTSYQWFKDGVPIAYTNSATYTVLEATAGDAGTYRVEITGVGSTTVSANVTVFVSGEGGDGRLINLSVRSGTGTGNSTLAVGFYVAGGTSQQLPVLVRGVGPSLGSKGVNNTLPDPALTLFKSNGTQLDTNNDWGGDTAIANVLPTVGAFAFDSTDTKDAALLSTLNTGGYTAHVTSADGGTGVALAEIYDAATSSAAQLVNVSARSQVGTGENVLIAGFGIINAPRTVLIRGIGPTLGSADFGIAGALSDAKLELYDIRGVKITENDNWNSADATRFAEVGAFPLPIGSKDSDIIIQLPPGGYTAVLSGVGGATGIGLIEVYSLPEISGAQPLWRDDFYQSANTAPDPAKWTYDLGGGGWGNSELEIYTSALENAHVVSDPAATDGRALSITAIKTLAGTYTSARLKTQGLMNFSYGRVEARLKLPKGQGIWPAFWLLGANIGTVGWPACGEVDIMEYLGHDQIHAYGTMHGPGYSGANGIGTSTTLPGMASLADAYHIYAVDWTPNEIKWSLDGNVFFTTTPASLPNGTTWVFNNNPMFILLNLAVGGQWPGFPDSTTVFPQEYRIDYVRVYDLSGS